MKKIIALSPRNNRLFESDIYNVYKNYFDAIQAAGAIPILLPEANEADLLQILKLVDGVIITGGNDVNPDLYGERPTFAKKIAKREEDENDLRLIDLCIKNDIPLLGICKGLQLLNVYFGGTLYQDIEEDGASKLDHNQEHLKHPTDAMQYGAAFEKGSFFHAVYGNTHNINSYHHQAIKDLGEGLIVSARDLEDQIIEAVEAPKHRAYAVQWHPEYLIYDAKHLKLFQTFINEIC